MESLNEFQRRKLIGQFYEKHRQKGKIFTVKHFIEMGLKIRPTYNITSRIGSKIPLKKFNDSGRKAIKMNYKKIESLINSLDGKKGISQNRIAQNYNISQSYACKILAWTGVKYYN